MEWSFSNLVPGHEYALCLNEKEFDWCLESMGIEKYLIGEWLDEGYPAITHRLNNGSEVKYVVCMKDWEGFVGASVAQSIVPVYAMLAHEAVHIWQYRCEDIGEDNPGKEIEAYSIQSIFTCLLDDFLSRGGV